MKYFFKKEAVIGLEQEFFSIPTPVFPTLQEQPDEIYLPKWSPVTCSHV